MERNGEKMIMRTKNNIFLKKTLKNTCSANERKRLPKSNLKEPTRTCLLCVKIEALLLQRCHASACDRAGSLVGLLGLLGRRVRRFQVCHLITRRHAQHQPPAQRLRVDVEQPSNETITTQSRKRPFLVSNSNQCFCMTSLVLQATHRACSGPADCAALQIPLGSRP